jgi:prephenate dehydrogenase
MTCNDSDKLQDYTGDSFRDLTRISKINDAMWSELFLMNKEFLIKNMDDFQAEFNRLRNMIYENDTQGIREMMRRSTERRTLFDKKK